MALKHVNAVVIGAGAGGGVVAKELSEAGLSVVLLERGGWIGFEEHDHDELWSQRGAGGGLGVPFGPDNRHPRVTEVGPGKWATVSPSDGSYGNNAACVGSGTVSYGAMAWRYAKQDFTMRSTYGALEGSTLEDWPVSYDELEPFYEKAEWEIGVSGDMSGNPHSPPRRKGFPMPPFPYNTAGKRLFGAAQRMGCHPFPIPMLRNSVSFQNRNACIKCRYCVGFACEINAKNGSHNTVIPTALATGNCQLITHAIASEIVVDERGRARGVRYFDSKDRAQYQTCDLVVCAGGAMESARLLLNSKSRLFPNGAGNRYDWVGRNLQSHAYAGAAGLFDDEVYDDVGSGATVGLADFNHGVSGIRGGGVLTQAFILLPIGFTRMRPPGSPSWGKAHKDFQRHNYRRYIGIEACTQEMPMWEQRVEIDPTVKDHWGIPVLRVSGNRHPHTLEVASMLADKSVQWLKEAGARQAWGNIPRYASRGGQHQAGTCRMGNDPKASVTNKYGQLHEIDNLFVADGGLHVTNGGYNPVLTIMALGYWVSDYIKRNWKGGGFR